MEALNAKIIENLPKAAAIIFSGSVLCSIDKNIYKDLIELCNNKGTKQFRYQWRTIIEWY